MSLSKAELEAYAKEGYAQIDVAKEVGLSRARISALAKKHGVIFPKKPPKLVARECPECKRVRYTSPGRLKEYLTDFCTRCWPKVRRRRQRG